MALLEDPSDTFLFGLTGLDALDFLISDDQQQLPRFTGLDYDAYDNLEGSHILVSQYGACS